MELYGAGEAYLPLLEALGRLGRAAGGEQIVQILKQHAPTWLTQLPALLADADLEAVQRRAQGATRDRMLRELVEALDALSADEPLILLLEDLHWSDSSTIDLLARLAGRREAARLLVLGTYRPADVAASAHSLSAVKQELQMHGHCEEMPLDFLSAAAVSTYLSQRFPRHEFPSELALVLHRKTGGNPLFVVNTLDDLIAQGQVREVDGTWGLSVPVKDLAAGGTGDAVAAGGQAGRAPDGGRASDVGGGERGGRGVLARRSPARTASTPRTRSCGARRWRGEASFFARPASPSGRMGRWQGGMPSSMRCTSRCCMRASPSGSGWDCTCGPPSVSSGATASARARSPASSRRTSSTAGTPSGRRGIASKRPSTRCASTPTGRPPTTRRGRCACSARCPGRPERTQQELTLQVLLGAALTATQGYAAPEVARTYARARELCERVGDTTQLFPVLLGLGRFYLVRGEFQTARDIGAQLLTMADATRDTVPLLAAHNALGVVSFYAGEFEAALAHLERGIALYDPEAHSPDRSPAFRLGQDPGVSCTTHAALTLWMLGYPARAAARMQEAFALARSLDHPFSVAYACHFAAGLHQWRRDRQAVRAVEDEALALDTEHGFGLFLTAGAIQRGWLLAEDGREEEGLAQMREGLARHRSIGAEVLVPAFLAMVAEVYGKLGRRAEGLSAVSEALVAGQQSGQHYWEAELHRLRGALTHFQRRRRREADDAEACFLEAMEWRGDRRRNRWSCARQRA